MATEEGRILRKRETIKSPDLYEATSNLRQKSFCNATVAIPSVATKNVSNKSRVLIKLETKNDTDDDDDLIPLASFKNGIKSSASFENRIKSSVSNLDENLSPIIVLTKCDDEVSSCGALVNNFHEEGFINDVNENVNNFIVDVERLNEVKEDCNPANNSDDKSVRVVLTSQHHRGGLRNKSDEIKPVKLHVKRNYYDKCRSFVSAQNLMLEKSKNSFKTVSSVNNIINGYQCSLDKLKSFYSEHVLSTFTPASKFRKKEESSLRNAKTFQHQCQTQHEKRDIFERGRRMPPMTCPVCWEIYFDADEFESHYRLMHNLVYLQECGREPYLPGPFHMWRPDTDDDDSYVPQSDVACLFCFKKNINCSGAYSFCR